MLHEVQNDFRNLEQNQRMVSRCSITKGIHYIYLQMIIHENNAKLITSDAANQFPVSILATDNEK